MERIDGRIIHDVYLDRVVFRETFTGDGAETEFTLSGPDAAQVTFKYGAWAVANVKTTLPSHVTKTNKKPAYDALIPLARTRIAVTGIDAAGVVTLNEPPRAIDFYIWYWYDLPNHHLLENYYREDFVASMEEEATAYGGEITVDTTDFAGIFTAADDTVQKAFDTADDHLHDGQTLQLDGINSNGGAFTFDTTGVVTFNNKISMGTNLISDVVDPIADQDAATKKYVDDGIWMFPPIERWHDPTGGLPGDPAIGDRYGSDGTGYGWTDGYIYEWDGEEWIESEPEEGWTIWCFFELLFYVFFSGGWMALPGTDHSELDNLAWSVAGHTFDAAVDFNSQALTSVGAIGCGAITTSGMLTIDSAAALILLHDSGTNVGHYIMSSDTTESSGYGEFSIWRCTGAAGGCVLGDNPPLMWADSNLNVSFPKAVTMGYFGGNLTLYGNIVMPANGVIGVTDGNPQIVFDNVNNWLEITGDVGINEASPDELLHITSNTANKPVLKIENTTDNALGAFLIFYKTGHSTPADGDVLGSQVGRGLNSSMADTQFMNIQFRSSDVTADHDAGAVRYRVKVDNTLKNLLELDGYGQGAQGGASVVINEQSIDCDFRVESNGSTHALFVEGSSGNIKMSSLAGAGSRAVVADADGVLSAP